MKKDLLELVEKTITSGDFRITHPLGPTGEAILPEYIQKKPKIEYNYEKRHISTYHIIGLEYEHIIDDNYDKTNDIEIEIYTLDIDFKDDEPPIKIRTSIDTTDTNEIEIKTKKEVVNFWGKTKYEYSTAKVKYSSYAPIYNISVNHDRFKLNLSEVKIIFDMIYSENKKNTVQKTELKSLINKRISKF